MAEDEPPGIELTQENMYSPDGLRMLGAMAIMGLKEYGQVTFVVRPDGGITFANPAHVFVHPQAIAEIADKPYTFVRPILGSGRPEYVVMRDGLLWEIKFDETEEEKVSG